MQVASRIALVTLFAVAACDAPTAPTSADVQIRLDPVRLHYDPTEDRIEGRVAVTVESTGRYPIHWSAYQPTWEIEQDGEWTLAYQPTIAAVLWEYQQVMIPPGESVVREFAVRFKPPQPAGRYRVSVSIAAVLGEDHWQQIEGLSNPLAIGDL